MLEVFDGASASAAFSEAPSALSRLLLLPFSLDVLCLRFGVSELGYCGGSGNATADAIELYSYKQSNMELEKHEN